MTYICEKYTTARQWIFAKKSWNRFYTFASLPELKFIKTVGFIVTILL